MEDLDTGPLMVQEPLESDPCKVPVGSHIGVLVQLLAALLGRLHVEVLMKLLCELHGGFAHDGPRQDRGGLALADLHSTLEGWVHTEMPVVGSVEVVPAGVVEVGPAEVVEVGPAELVEVGPAGVVPEVQVGLVELVPSGLVELVPVGLVEVGPAGVVEVGPAGVVEMGPAGLVEVVSAGDSGLPDGLLAPGSLPPSYIFLAADLSTSLRIQLPLYYTGG